MKMYLMKGMVALAMGLVAASCNKMEFADQAQVSQEEALVNAEMQLGVEIDPNQDWKMTKEVQADVRLNMGTGEEYTLIVYDKSPFVYDDAVYYAKQTVTDGSNVSLKTTVPSGLSCVYVTLLDSKGLSISKRSLISEDVFAIEFNAESAKAPSMAMRRANSGQDYNATSIGINANANEWADPTPDKTFGGWVVPDPLTAEQKEVVMKYFQANPKLGYQDPEWRHFFVQQVYKGGTNKPETGNKETNTDGNGNSYTSDNMNLLTVGVNEWHINNFNAGSYGTEAGASSVGVLDKGYTANDFDEHHHTDQIMLMVNIDDTSCFGYHNSGCSKQKNDKAGLVGWETIRTWANSTLGAGKGDCLNDGWNRSFLGFDFELYSKEDSYLRDGNNQIVYAKMTDGQNGGLQYVWDGSNVIARGTASVADVDLTSRFTNLWNESETKTNNADGSITYHAVQWGGLSAWIGNSIDFSPYQSLVVEFAEATTIPTQLVIDYGDEWGSWGTSKCEAVAGATEIDYDFARNYLSNLNKIRQVALQTAENGVVKISRIYLKGKQGEAGYGDYLLVDGKKVPFIITNMNFYSGSVYGGRDEALSDAEMKTNQNGKECFNMVKIAELVHAGYLPVKDKNLRTWVKWAGGDGYYSDWIVTLTKAERIPEEEIHEEEPPQNAPIWSYAFEDTFKGDYDMNDVVLKVQENGDNIDVWLVAAGATLDLTIKLYQYDANNEADNFYGQFVQTLIYKGETEIHKMWGVDPGTMVNTGAGANAKPIRIAQLPKSSYEADKLRFSINSAAWEVKLAGSGMAPYGVMIPMDWKWPRERVRITNAYNKTDAPETETDQSFSNFMSNAGHAELWYKYPTGSTMIVDFE